MEIEDGSERSGELHEASVEEALFNRVNARERAESRVSGQQEKAQRLALLYKKAGGGLQTNIGYSKM